VLFNENESSVTKGQEELQIWQLLNQAFPSAQIKNPVPGLVVDDE